MTRAPNREQYRDIGSVQSCVLRSCKSGSVEYREACGSAARRIVQTSKACNRRFQSDGCVCHLTVVECTPEVGVEVWEMPMMMNNLDLQMQISRGLG